MGQVHRAFGTLGAYAKWTGGTETGKCGRFSVGEAACGKAAPGNTETSRDSETQADFVFF